MRSKSVVLLVLALGCGLVASIGISQVMERRNAPVDQGETEPIFVALADINYNDLLTPQLIKLEEWPKSKVPQGAITKLEDTEGKRCKVKMFAGEPLVAAKLMGHNEGTGAAVEIPKGFRVIAVQVNSTSGTAGLIQPGDRVDVMVHMSKNPATGIAETHTRTILQDVKVFAVDTVHVGVDRKEDQAAMAKTISLLVKPEQAEVVTLATEIGQIRLALRGPDDNSVEKTAAATIQELLGLASANNPNDERSKPAGQQPGLLDLLSNMKNQGPPAAAAAPAAAPRKMVLIEGDQVREVLLAADGSVGPGAAAPSGDSTGGSNDNSSSGNPDDNSSSPQPSAAPANYGPRR